MAEIDDDTLTEAASAITDANEALTRAAEALAGAMKEPAPAADSAKDDPGSLANNVKRGY